MTFYEKLDATLARKNSLLCIGLDPDPERFPSSLKHDSDRLFRFCSEIIAATAPFAAAFKLNFAFFEAEGSAGWSALERLMARLPGDTLSLADAKRADIGNSSRMYARAILHRLNFDAVTVNPYLGYDSVEPFLAEPEKGAFILGVTSNPGARDFQDAELATSQPLYEYVIRRAAEWNTRENCSLVVGATHPEQMQRVRRIVPDMPFLIPGIGAQGGSLADAVICGTDAQAGRALINSSRSILYKSSSNDFAEAAGQEAQTLCQQINHFRNQKTVG